MGIIIILLPLLLYLIAALSVKKGAVEHPDDYFAAFRKVGQTEFTSSSIAYGFQVSTIYPFLFWGASMFLFVPFVNAICWGIGIFLFYLSINKVSKHLDKSLTLHGLLGQAYGEKVRLLASILTIVGFIGYIVAELWFGSRVLLSVLPNTNLIYGIVLIFIGFITFYLYRNGQLSSLRTDQLQLSLTYLGVFGIIIYLLYLSHSNLYPINGALSYGLLTLLLFVPIILIIRKFKFVSFGSLFDKILNTIVVLSFISILILSIIILIQNPKSFDLTGFYNIEGFGFAGLASLIILPLGWQFVDLTNWQRLLALNDSNINQNKSLKRGLLDFSIESPFTWLLFLIFGLLISVSLPDLTFNDILIDFPKQFISSNLLLENILGYTFIISIISIMLSTVDSFFMGISFTYIYDINQQTRKIIEFGGKVNNTQNILNKGKVFSVAVILFSFLLFIIFDKTVQGGGDLFINLLLTFYSAILALLPLVVGFLFLKKLPKQNWAIASSAIGAFFGISIGIYSVLFNPSLAWYPIIISVCISSIIFLIGKYIFR